MGFRLFATLAGLAVISCVAVGWVLSRPSLNERLQRARLDVHRDPAAARTQVLDILDDYPDSVAAWQIAAAVQARLGDVDAAIQWYDRLLQEAEDHTLDVPQAFLTTLMESGHHATAERYLRQLLAQNPNQEFAWRQLSTLLLTHGRRWEAQHALRQLLRLGRLHLDELIMLGSQEEFLEDAATLRAAVSQNRTAAGPLTGLGHLAQLQGEIEVAEQYFRQATALTPILPEAWAGLGTLLLEHKPQALPAWRQSLPEQQPEHPQIQYVLGRLALHEGRRQQAAEHFAATVRSDPDHRAACQFLANLQAAAGADRSAQVLRNRARQLDSLEQLLHRVLFGDSDPTLKQQVAELLHQLQRHPEEYAWWMLILQQHPQLATLASERAAAALSETGLESETIPESLQTAVATDISLPDLPPIDWAAVPDATDTQRVSAIRFADVSQAVGLTSPYFGGYSTVAEGLWIYQQFGGGAGVIDLDGDDRPDLFFTQGSVWPVDPQDSRSRDDLYRNLGDRFIDVSAVAVPPDYQFGQGIAVGDLNNDGFADLYVANIGSNQILLNQGDGTFREAQIPALSEVAEWTTSCLLADITGDGIEDLYDANYVAGKSPFERICRSGEQQLFRGCKPTFFDPAPDRLLQGLGDGTFRDTSAASQLSKAPGRGLGIVAADLDASGDLEVFISNDMTANHLLVRSSESSSGSSAAEYSAAAVLSDSTASNGVAFRDLAAAAGVAASGEGRVEACMGVAADDINADGRPDLFVTNFYEETNTLYTNQSGLFFRDDTDIAGLAASSRKLLGFGTQFIDAELDGDPDLLLVNGHVDDFQHLDVPWKMPPQLYANTGQGGFELLDAAAVLGSYGSQPALGRSMAKLDWNRDGLEDAVVTHLEGPPALLSNQTASHGNFLSLQLVGTRSARTAVGAIVRLTLPDRQIVLQRMAGNGYYCSNDWTLIAGTGAATEIPQVEVRWPSGNVQRFAAVAGNRRLRIVEGRDRLFEMIP